MTAAVTVVPPAVALFALAAVTPRLSRRAGHGVATVGALAACLWLLVVPAGTHLDTTLFGFEAVLFEVDAYSRLLGVALGFVAAVGTLYAFVTGADRRQTAYALAYVGSGLGAAFAGDWLTLVVFWELMALWATVLLWHRTTDRSVGVRYAIYHELGGLALMAGVLLHYARVGTFVYGDGITAGLPAVLVALGIGLNAGFVGLHVWVADSYPSTHVAATVVLAAVTTKVGAYAIVRAFPGGHPVLAYLGGAMVVFGVTFAILQTDMRRLLSYHIVSQVGYIVAGFGAGSALASVGAMAHLVNHVLYKSLLFMVAGVLIQRTGRESLKKVGGVGRAMPLTAGVFLVAAFSITGLPGFNGFVSKGMVIDGVEKAGHRWLWYVLVAGGVGTVVSFAKFGYYAFLHGHDGHDESNDLTDLSGLELVALGSVAALCLVLGLVPSLLLELLPAKGVASAKPYAGKQFVKTGAVTVTGLLVFLAIRSRLARVTGVSDLGSVYEPLGRRLQSAAVEAAVAVDTGIERAGASAAAITREFDVEVPGGPSIVSSDFSESIGAGILAIGAVLALLFVLLFV